MPQLLICVILNQADIFSIYSMGGGGYRGYRGGGRSHKGPVTKLWIKT